MFIDIANIKLKAGDGGNGCRSFHRARGNKFSIPNGGDGGKGADIIFCADSKIATLLDFRFRQHFKAGNGAHASSNNKRGKDAPGFRVRVPVGTLITDVKSKLILRDLKRNGEEVIAVKGGRGGRGNGVTRGEAEKGAPGEEREVCLELKMIADVAIVGLPNAGKSSLITQLSGARPKVAAYPFTTKAPVLGVYDSSEFSCVFVDVPGLIEGAHLGKGLGDRFLRHIERTRLVVQVVDISNLATTDPVSAYKVIDKELTLYGADLDKRERIIVGNKIDLEGWQKNLARLKQAADKPVIAISCLERKGLKALIDEIREKL